MKTARAPEAQAAQDLAMFVEANKAQLQEFILQIGSQDTPPVTPVQAEERTQAVRQYLEILQWR